MKYEKIIEDALKEVYRVKFENFENTTETAYVEVEKIEYINKSQLEYILKDESARQLKNYKTDINRR
jgi:hypothetical protein